MTVFEDLPLELLPLIVRYVPQPWQLARVAAVNRAFNVFATERLYQAIYIYAWHKNAKVKVLSLVRTLATCRHLATYVRHLTIRDFMKGTPSDQREELLELCVQAIRNCTNLQGCAWTRDGSLSTNMLHALSDAKHLSTLEINGHHQHSYDPEVLRELTHLRKLTLIMPSSAVVGVLPSWTAAMGANLRHLTLFCKDSTAITDKSLHNIAPHIVNLERLYLVGCPKVSHDGLWAILSNTRTPLLGLGLEGMSPTFDISWLTEHCQNFGTLKSLSTTRLSVDHKMLVSGWTLKILELFKDSPLTEFELSSTGGEIGLTVGWDFCWDFVKVHGAHLRRFSVHRLYMDPLIVKGICKFCPKLEELFVTMEQDDLDALGPCLAHGKNLRIVHIHRPVGQEDSETEVVVPVDRILAILQHSHWPLRLIGFNTRVHQVEREIVDMPDGSYWIRRSLTAYESPRVPEQFLVLRT